MGFGQRHGNSGYGNNHGSGRFFNRGKKKPKSDFTERQQVAKAEGAPQPQPVNVDANQPSIYSGFQLWVHSPLTLNCNGFDTQVAVSPENEQRLISELGQLADDVRGLSFSLNSVFIGGSLPHLLNWVQLLF
jgi:hypothetical protein